MLRETRKTTPPKREVPRTESRTGSVRPLSYVVRGSVVETPEGFKIRF